jgi:hypothetical protein
MIWIVLGVVIVIAGLAILHSRVKAWNAAVTFPEFLESVSIAADEAESAYVAQVNMLSGNRNQASPKGIALPQLAACQFQTNFIIALLRPHQLGVLNFSSLPLD